MNRCIHEIVYYRLPSIIMLTTTIDDLLLVTLFAYYYAIHINIEA